MTHNGTVQVESSWVEEVRKKVLQEEENRKRMTETRASMGGDVESTLRSLDSTLKKTTAFMKKVKALNAAAVVGLIEELAKLNLSKFVEEMAMGIAETKLKVSDIMPVVELCVAISARQLKKSLPLKRADKVGNVAKLRIDIIFLAELTLSGVFFEKEGLQILSGVLGFLVQTDKTEHVNVGLLVTVCRNVGWQIAGLVPQPVALSAAQISSIYVADLPVPKAITNEQKKAIHDLLMSYHASLLKRVEKACAARNSAQKVVKRQQRTRGDAGDEEKQILSARQKEFDEARNLALELSAALGVTMKEMKEEQSDDEEDEMAAQELRQALAGGVLSLWPDEETKVFYENLIDIRKFVPKALYKDSENRTVEKNKMESNIEDVDVDDINEAGEIDDLARLRSASPESKFSSRESSPIRDLLQNVEGVNEDGKAKWAKFNLYLDHLVSKDLTDKAAHFFVTDLNNKTNRKKLVKVLTTPPPHRMDLVPFFARLISTLELVMPDVTCEIVNSLISQFRGLMQKTGTERVEAKMSCVMLIAELMKFGVIPRAEGLSCLRQLVYDLRGHAVEMAATMLEAGGMYLYRNTDSHPKMKRLLEVVKAKRDRMKDPRQVMLIDNAYFCCVPPEDGATKSRLQPEEPLMKRFIRHLVVDITEPTVDSHLRGFRRIDWADKEISDFVLRCISSPWLVPMENLPHLASAVAGFATLSSFGWVGVAVVDSVVETIRLSLEVPGVFNQWAHASVVYLGELFNYNLCDSDLVLKVLYQIISFQEADQLSWQDLYRIRMVCALVKTSGEFFQKGSLRNKMEGFLTYFHRFYFFKKEIWTQAMTKAMTFSPVDESAATASTSANVQTKFPFDIETAFAEMCKMFRKTKFPKTLEQAEAAVVELENSLKPKIEAVLGGVFDTFSAEDDDIATRQSPNKHRALNAIFEEEDDEEARTSDRDAVFCDVDDEDDDQKLHVHMEQQRQVTKQEEEEFQRELDRMVADNLRSSGPTTSNAFDMTVPPSARHRFERSVKFASAEPNEKPKGPTFSMAAAKETIATTSAQPNKKVSLMTRGKGNKAQLKTVQIDDKALHDSWKTAREDEERERADMKRVTLGHTRRIQAEEDNELFQSIQNPRAGQRTRKL
ncbi:unnamed protein product [Caenorhabditis auriculariae]|uniref:MIF4G domain-containing protein n=1 Tax=Caenorhabditis auriculariae TaxID=2777116 RepID=A0A8S1HD60_9PELO|nr:unnamed protein product [Caenorhabditis auriculariae]